MARYLAAPHRRRSAILFLVCLFTYLIFFRCRRTRR